MEWFAYGAAETMAQPRAEEIAWICRKAPCVCRTRPKLVSAWLLSFVRLIKPLRNGYQHKKSCGGY